MALPQVFEIWKILLQYSSNGPATLDFYTDAAAAGAGTLASALSAPVVIPVTGMDRYEIMKIPLGGIRATEFYPKIVPGKTTQFVVYGMILLIRPLPWIEQVAQYDSLEIPVDDKGIALNGAEAEIWQTVPLVPCLFEKSPLYTVQ